MKNALLLIWLLAFPLSIWGASIFKDSDLQVRLTDKRPGVIYLWSPFMPLSVMGRDEIYEVAAALDLDLVTLVDPLALKGSTPDQIFGSSVLSELGMLDHYPALVLYADGRILEQTLVHGYEQKASLTILLKKYLTGTQR